MRRTKFGALVPFQIEGTDAEVKEARAVVRWKEPNSDYEECEDDDGNTISPEGLDLQQVLAAIDKLERDIGSVIHFGSGKHNRRKGAIRRKKMLRLLATLRTDLEFNDYILAKEARSF